MLYLRNNSLNLAPVGSLAARPGGSKVDGCHVSCINWYGKTRPIFPGNRVIALMGFELVERRLLKAPGVSERLLETRHNGIALSSADYQP